MFWRRKKRIGYGPLWSPKIPWLEPSYADQHAVPLFSLALKDQIGKKKHQRLLLPSLESYFRWYCHWETMISIWPYLWLNGYKKETTSHICRIEKRGSAGIRRLIKHKYRCRVKAPHCRLQNTIPYKNQLSDSKQGWCRLNSAIIA